MSRRSASRPGNLLITAWLGLQPLVPVLPLVASSTWPAPAVAAAAVNAPTQAAPPELSPSTLLAESSKEKESENEKRKKRQEAERKKQAEKKKQEADQRRRQANQDRQPHHRPDTAKDRQKRAQEERARQKYRQQYEDKLRKETQKVEEKYSDRYDKQVDKLRRQYSRGYVPRPQPWSSWDSNRWSTYNRSPSFDPWQRPVSYSSPTVRPGWIGTGGVGNRPWDTGWYGNWNTANSPPWGWWGGQSGLWGLAGLAASALINSAMNQAIQQGQPTIVVPTTNWQLVYGSVEPQGIGAVSFVVSNGSGIYRLTADCNEGLLEGRVPYQPAQAQLVNAACQVAYGDVANSAPIRDY